MDMNGETTEKLLEDVNLVCLNDGRGTRMDLGTGKALH